MKSIAILGSGPSGLLAAHVLAEYANVTVLETGMCLPERTSKTQGLGGGGTFSDGKFNFDPNIGGQLSQLVGDMKVSESISLVDSFFVNHGAPMKGATKDGDLGVDLRRRFRSNGFSVREGKIKHWGTDKGPKIITSIHECLVERGVEFKFSFPPIIDIDSILSEHDAVFIAVGRSGFELMRQIHQFMPCLPGATDIGVRYECPNEVFEEVEDSFEPKVTLRSSFGEAVRSFCACLDGGKVTVEDYPNLNINCVNGHRKSVGSGDNSNLAILATVEFTKPFDDPNGYCKSICETCNALAGGKILVQAHQDILRGRRSTPKRIVESGIVPSLEDAVPGDITFAMPYRQMTGILEFIEAFDGVLPGFARGLLYAPEVKFYASKADIDPETLAYRDRPNLFPVGDCSGWTRSLPQAAVHGMLAAKKLLERIT